MGLVQFADRAAAAGVDGVLALDLPIEEADEFRSVLAAQRRRYDLSVEPDDDRRAHQEGGGAWPRIPVRHLAAGRHRRARSRGRRAPKRWCGASGSTPRMPIALGLWDFAAGARGGSRPVRRCRGRRQRAGVAHCRGERVAAAARTRRTLRARSQERLRSLTDIYAHDLGRLTSGHRSRGRSAGAAAERTRTLRLRNRPAEKGIEHRGLSAGPREGRAAPRAGSGVRRAARAGRDRPAVRTHHRRSAHARAARRARRDATERLPRAPRTTARE